jgi:transposase-like protein
MLEEECLRLRMEGLSHREIAAQLGIAPSTAYKRVRHALDGINQRNAAEADTLRTLELLRLDELQDAVWEQALAGDDKALGRVLAIMGRRAKLLGLDAPAKAEVAVSPYGTRLRRQAIVKEIMMACVAEQTAPS